MVDAESVDSASPVANAVVSTWDTDALVGAGGPTTPPPRNGRIPASESDIDAPADARVLPAEDRAWLDKWDRAVACPGGVQPLTTQYVTNATCIGYHEFCSLASFPGSPPANAETLQIAYGSATQSSSGDAPAPSDTSLFSPLQDGQFPIDTSSRDGATLVTQSTLYRGSLTGERIAEVGLVGPDGRLWNHAALPDPVDSKNSNETVTTTISIINQDASEVSTS